MLPRIIVPAFSQLSDQPGALNRRSPPHNAAVAPWPHCESSGFIRLIRGVEGFVIERIGASW